MPSPFPGMNPYLERDIAWHDFHKRFLILGAGIIGAQIRPDYIVRVDDHIGMPLEAYLSIIDRQSREVVTVVELLSPANKQKSGPDRVQYLARRDAVLASQASLVEIDLLRGGEPMPGEPRPSCAYSVLVSRPGERPDSGFWPLELSGRLPVVPIPLRSPRPDASLDLQALLHRVYDEAGYEFYIYDGPPQPALTPEEAAWAEPFLAQGP